MQDAKEEVRSRLSIEDVVSEYVELKRAGRNFKGLSPFTSEQTPSFFVSPDKAIWHDFSSGKGGDVFSFVMEVEGLDFKEALEQLARKAGLDLSLYRSASGGRIAARKKRLIEAIELATQYFQASMVKNTWAQEYIFAARGLDKIVVNEFKVGYAPDNGKALTTFLAKRGFNKDELRDAGLTNRFGGDLFRGRMMVPLQDPSGQTIGFTGRIIEDIPDAPKYLNTPQTLLYDKSRHVFGLSQAKQAIREMNQAVLVEGNLDVISSHQVGIRNVVATAGTALTEHHLRALGRLTNDIRLAFDGDKAGVAAAERAIGIASQLGLSLTIISIPEDSGAKDPDDLIKQSPDAWQRAIDDAQPAVEWLFGQFGKKVDLGSAEGKRSFTTAALEVVRGLSDAVERDHYEQKVADMIGGSKAAIHEKLTSTATSQSRRKEVKVSPIQPVQPDSSDIRQDAVLALGLIDPATRDLFRQYESELFDGDSRQAIVRFLQTHPKELITDTPKSLTSHDTYVKIVLLKAETRYAEWDAQHRYYEAAELLRQVQKEHKKQQKNVLQVALREAETNNDEVRANELLEQINNLDKEIIRG